MTSSRYGTGSARYPVADAAHFLFLPRFKSRSRPGCARLGSPGIFEAYRLQARIALGESTWLCSATRGTIGRKPGALKGEVPLNLKPPVPQADVDEPCRTRTADPNHQSRRGRSRPDDVYRPIRGLCRTSVADEQMKIDRRFPRN